MCVPVAHSGEWTDPAVPEAQADPIDRRVNATEVSAFSEYCPDPKLRGDPGFFAVVCDWQQNGNPSNRESWRSPNSHKTIVRAEMPAWWKTRRPTSRSSKPTSQP